MTIELIDRDAGRVAGAFEARGGVVIASAMMSKPENDSEYYGIRLYIETLTVNVPLHSVFGEPKVRAAYSRPVYRYEVTKRSEVLEMAKFLNGHVFDDTRRKELAAAIEFCEAKDAAGRKTAYLSLSALRT